MDTRGYVDWHKKISVTNYLKYTYKYIVQIFYYLYNKHFIWLVQGSCCSFLRSSSKQFRWYLQLLVSHVGPAGLLMYLYSSSLFSFLEGFLPPAPSLFASMLLYIITYYRLLHDNVYYMTYTTHIQYFIWLVHFLFILRLLSQAFHWLSICV